MKKKSNIFVMIFLTLCMNAITVNAQNLNVNDIVEKSNHVSLYQGYDVKGKMKFIISDKQGRIRKRELNILRKNDERKNGDQKYFTYFIAPSDVRGMTFMVHKHADVKHDDDRWLYMPGLDLVKRIAASDKRTSFVGSDFLYEDISGRSPKEDRHELIKTTDEFYVIKNVPKNKTVEFEYYLAYVDKKNYIAMKIEYYKKNGFLYREIFVEEVKNIVANDKNKQKTYPTVTRSVARDLEKGGKTEMIFSRIKYNTDINNNVFTERYLRRPSRDVMR